MNTLPYELIVQESIKTKEQLRGKSIGISRIGSSSDVIARVFLKHLGLEPDKDVAIIQVGGSGERAAAFRTGKIAAFPAPPGVLHLTKGMPQRVLVSTAEFPKPYAFPYICGTTTKTYLASNRPTVKRLVMALTEGVNFFKTRKEEEQKNSGQIFSTQRRSLLRSRLRDQQQNFSTACPTSPVKAWIFSLKRRCPRNRVRR